MSLILRHKPETIIISPHPRAKKSTIEAAKIVLDAAVKAGAPEEINKMISKVRCYYSRFMRYN